MSNQERNELNVHLLTVSLKMRDFRLILMHKLFSIVADKFTFFYHAIPPRAADGSISTLALFELHDLVRDVWLARHDYALGEEAKSRRKGRPKSVREVNLENMKASEAEEYRTGLGAISLI